MTLSDEDTGVHSRAAHQGVIFVSVSVSLTFLIIFASFLWRRVSEHKVQKQHIT